MGKEKLLSSLIKGFVIGGTMTVPGVSGGTMAILLGIYDDLIGSVNRVWKDGGRNFVFLLVVAFGGGVGLLTCSGFLLNLLEKYPLYCGYFFVGAVGGGIPLLISSAGIRKIRSVNLLWPLLGLGLVLGIGRLPTGVFQMEVGGGLGFWFVQFLCGLLLAIALILPGISVSHMLLILGLYECIMEAVREFRFLSLLPLMLGVGVGILFFSKYLEKAMKKAPQVTYLVILGFVVASLFQICPKIPKMGELWSSVLCLGLGFLITFYLAKKEMRGEKEEEGVPCMKQKE